MCGIKFFLIFFSKIIFYFYFSKSNLSKHKISSGIYFQNDENFGTKEILRIIFTKIDTDDDLNI